MISIYLMLSESSYKLEKIKVDIMKSNKKFDYIAITTIMLDREFDKFH